ncbi:hypothetical protein BaRGS_00035584 [Batillaria attramentaria]|uniref:Apple domain-containing protein n=1 Tax=Batillaria attramentaria TaxID=370345 RepID=A0ABD0JEW5_9CAEN
MAYCETQHLVLFLFTGVMMASNGVIAATVCTWTDQVDKAGQQAEASGSDYFLADLAACQAACDAQTDCIAVTFQSGSLTSCRVDITNISNVPYVANLTNIPDIAYVSNVSNITYVSNVANITNVSSVANIANVTNVTYFAYFANVPNISYFAYVANITYSRSLL